MKIIFICYGNICRSPMAEYIFKSMLKKAKIEGVEVVSRGTSSEEEGRGVHRGTRGVLEAIGIDCSAHIAKRLSKAECDECDLLLCMDQYNVWHTEEIAGEENKRKIKKLLEFSSHPRDIDDPWYTHDFKRSYREIVEGLNGLIKYVKSKD